AVRRAPPAFDVRPRRLRRRTRRGGSRVRLLDRAAGRVHFLTNYDSSYFNIQIRARDYYAFTSLLLLAVALSFEVPVFVLGLVRLRIVSAANLRHGWRVGIFAMTVLGVLLPGVDPVSTGLSVLVLVTLYGLSIGLASFFEPRWRGSAAREAASDL